MKKLTDEAQGGTTHSPAIALDIQVPPLFTDWNQGSLQVPLYALAQVMPQIQKPEDSLCGIDNCVPPQIPMHDKSFAFRTEEK